MRTKIGVLGYKNKSQKHIKKLSLYSQNVSLKEIDCFRCSVRDFYINELLNFVRSKKDE